MRPARHREDIVGRPGHWREWVGMASLPLWRSWSEFLAMAAHRGGGWRVVRETAPPADAMSCGVAQGSRVAPEFIIWTPADASPSNWVTGLAAPRQPSSSLGSANQKPTELSSLRIWVSLLKANASSTMRRKVLAALP